MTATAPAPTAGIDFVSIPGLSSEIAALAERVSRSVVQIGQREGHGAGIIWRADGIIVTNRHVVRSDEVHVLLADGRDFTGKVTARHPETDLAVVQIDARDLPAIEVGDSLGTRAGQLALAIGHPIGYRQALTAGIIVAAGNTTANANGEWLQTDVTLLPGNSGGPLVDVEGRVLGMNTMVSGSLSLSVPSHVIEQYVATGRNRRGGYLGLEGTLVALQRDDARAGVLVSHVTPDGPADQAGLIIGDVITHVGTTAIEDQETLPAALARSAPGISLALNILRGGEPRTISVAPMERE